MTHRIMKPGDHLANGTILLASREEKGGFVVLCDTNSRAGDPWATWRCSRPDGADTESGRYFQSIAEAAHDFEAR